MSSIGVFGGFGDGFELDEDEGEAVDEADEIGAFGIDLAGDPHLGGEEEVVVGGVVPVDDADVLDLLASPGVLGGDLDAVAQELPDIVVGVDGMEGGTVGGDLVDGVGDGGGWEGWVEFGEGGAEAGGQDGVVAGFTAEGVGGSAELVVAALGLPSEAGEELDGGLLDEFVFRVVRHVKLRLESATVSTNIATFIPP